MGNSVIPAQMYYVTRPVPNPNPVTPFPNLVPNLNIPKLLYLTSTLCQSVYGLFLPWTIRMMVVYR